ncbi:uncharacterized protein BcabD6B2_40410 [Babesia caballi]|uniref:Uncharacterized protein n=1 Tax=Babesia caballi TaxID=5871 RepID=A0AAV4LWQ6_BABCB|nr:hypothetical protein BcabD6B2_40410 [Babesia caballi]
MGSQGAGRGCLGVAASNLLGLARLRRVRRRLLHSISAEDALDAQHAALYSRHAEVEAAQGEGVVEVQPAVAMTQRNRHVRILAQRVEHERVRSQVERAKATRNGGHRLEGPPALQPDHRVAPREMLDDEALRHDVQHPRAHDNGRQHADAGAAENAAEPAAQPVGAIQQPDVHGGRRRVKEAVQGRAQLVVCLQAFANEAEEEARVDSGPFPVPVEQVVVPRQHVEKHHCELLHRPRGLGTQNALQDSRHTSIHGARRPKLPSQAAPALERQRHLIHESAGAVRCRGRGDVGWVGVAGRVPVDDADADYALAVIRGALLHVDQQLQKVQERLPQRVRVEHVVVLAGDPAEGTLADAVEGADVGAGLGVSAAWAGDRNARRRVVRRRVVVEEPLAVEEADELQAGVDGPGDAEDADALPLVEPTGDAEVLEDHVDHVGGVAFIAAARRDAGRQQVRHRGRKLGDGLVQGGVEGDARSQQRGAEAEVAALQVPQGVPVVAEVKVDPGLEL